MSVGFLSSGPIAGRLSDRYGQRWFSTMGMVAAAVTFVLLLALPVNSPYPVFAGLILLNGLGVGAFAAPNTTTWRVAGSRPAAWKASRSAGSEAASGHGRHRAALREGLDHGVAGGPGDV